MFFRFILVGGSGFVVDVTLTYVLMLLNVEPWLARVPAIIVAMAYTWLANRCFTYKIKKARSITEVVRYGLVAVAMAMVNYLIYIVLLGYGLWPVAAVMVSTICQTIVSFHAYRRFAFREIE